MVDESLKYFYLAANPFSNAPTNSSQAMTPFKAPLMVMNKLDISAVK